VAIPLALATTRAAITPSLIARAKLGLGKVAYTKLLGAPVRYQAAGGGTIQEPGFQAPQNYTRLVFAKRKMDVYFQDGVDHAIEITTWNKAYRTAAGVGPCSTRAQLKAAYGSRLKPHPGSIVENGQPGAYIVGRSLIFSFSDYPPTLGTYSTFVTAVALYDGSKPGWNVPRGPMYFAGFVAGYPDQIPCRR
jgi:hypothetical protein